MSAESTIVAGRGADNDVRTVGLILSIALLLATGMAYGLYRFPPNGMVVAAGTIGLAGVVALALLRYELAVGLGFLLLGIVRSEPAPPDAIFGVVIAIAVVTGRFDLRRVPLAVFWLLGTFAALNILSATQAVDTAAAGRFMLITLYLAVFAIWLTAFVDSVARARLIVRTYIAGAVLWATLTSLAYYLPLPGREDLLAYRGTRGVALFEDPNVYGPFLIPAALIVMEEMLTPRFLRWGWPIKLLVFCILAIGVILSFSRAASVSLLAAMVVQLATHAMRRRGGRRAVAVFAAMVIGGAAVGGVLAVTGSIGFFEQRASLQTYDADRFGGQKQGISLAAQHPVGIGPGQFEVLLPIASHSTYVRALTEQGILGFFVIVGLLLTTLILAGRNAVLGRSTYGIGSAALLGAWVSLLINSLVVDTLHWRHLFFVAALIWAGSCTPEPRPYQAETPGPPLAAAGRLVR